MDFKITLKMLVTEFDKNSIDYALAGAFAMGALGVARATSDIDFLILASDTSKVADIMTGLGYKQTFSGENVSQYVSGIKTYGEIDFSGYYCGNIYDVLRRTSKQICGRSPNNKNA